MLRWSCLERGEGRCQASLNGTKTSCPFHILIGELLSNIASGLVYLVQIRVLECITTMSVHHYDYLGGSVNQCPVYHAGYLGHNRVWDQPANASQHHQHHDLTSNHALFIFCHFTIALPCFLDITCWIIPKFLGTLAKHILKWDDCDWITGRCDV